MDLSLPGILAEKCKNSEMLSEAAITTFKKQAKTS